MPWMISVPPARQKPLMAAMMGLKQVLKKRCSGFAMKRPPEAASAVSLVMVFLRSAPAQKDLSPAPVTISTSRSLSLLKSSVTTSRSSSISGVMEFISLGRLKVR